MWSMSGPVKLTCKSKGVTRDSLSSTVHMGLPLPSTILGSTIFPEVSPPGILLSFWWNRDELNTCSTRLEDFWEIRLAVLPVWSTWKENGGFIYNVNLTTHTQLESSGKFYRKSDEKSASSSMQPTPRHQLLLGFHQTTKWSLRVVNQPHVWSCVSPRGQELKPQHTGKTKDLVIKC